MYMLYILYMIRENEKKRKGKNYVIPLGTFHISLSIYINKLNHYLPFSQMGQFNNTSKFAAMPATNISRI